MKETGITDEMIVECFRNALDEHDDKCRLRDVDRDDLDDIFHSQIYHILNDDEITNANTLICADHLEVANTYGEVLRNALNAFSNLIDLNEESQGNNKALLCESVSKEALYEYNEKYREYNPNVKFLLLTNFETSDPDILYKTLTEFEAQNFTPAVILCTTNDTVEKLKEYDVQGHRLYNYLCGMQKITIPGINEERITDSICKRLEKKGKKVMDSFREKLRVHVDAIYRDAYLKEEEFVDDLIVRIASEHSKKSVDLWNQYDEEDVPFSKKAEALLKKIHNTETTVEEKIDHDEDKEKENVIDESVEKGEATNSERVDQVGCESESEDSEEIETAKEIEEITESSKELVKERKERTQDSIQAVKLECTATQLTEKEKDQFGGKKHQVLLMAMSTFPGPCLDKERNVFVFKENKYKREDNNAKPIGGCFVQMEPIAKMMLDEKMDDFSEVDFVIVGTEGTEIPKKILEPGKSEETISPNDYFERRIIDYLNEKNIVLKKNDEKSKSYSDSKKNKTVKFHVIRVDESEPIEGMEKIVDTLRDIYPGNKEDFGLWIATHGGFRDINVMMTSLLSLLKNEGIEYDEIYGTHQLSGNEYEIIKQDETFKMFDFVTGMNDFFKYGHSKVLEEFFGKQGVDSEDAYVEGIRLVDEGIQFSNADTYRRGINIMKKAIKSESDNKVLNIFRENIIEDFGDLVKSEKKASNLMLVKRCVEKGMFQQALTFLESCMMEDYYRDEIIKLNQGVDTFLNRKDNNNIKREGELPKKITYSRKDKDNRPFEYAIKNNNGNIEDKDKKDIFFNLILYCTDFLEAGDKNKIDEAGKEYLKNPNAEELRIKGEKKKVDKSFLSFNDNDLNFIKTSLPNDEHIRKSAGKLIRLHKALKQCRNKFNHADSGRPEIETIKRAFEIYFEIYEELLNVLQEEKE